MDARRSPQWIVDVHPPNQRAQLRVDLRSASKETGFRDTLVPTEASSMPSHQVASRAVDACGVGYSCLPCATSMTSSNLVVFWKRRLRNLASTKRWTIYGHFHLGLVAPGLRTCVGRIASFSH